RYRASGEIEYLGRLDDQVKIRGYRVELGEIEAAIAAQPSVAQVAVTVRKQASGDARLVAYVTAGTPSAIIDIPELRASLKERLPEYEIPSAFVVLDRLPLTVNGKVDRAALPEPDAPRGDADTSTAPH